MKIKRDNLDILFSKMLRQKHPRCQACHMAKSTQIHHFMGRRYQSVRYNQDNCWSLCFTCHRKFHENPEWGREMMRKRLGDKYDNFIILSQAICKRTKIDRDYIKKCIVEECRLLPTKEG